ncbi:MAG TPA: hypothetical protein VMI33_20360 [Streptosporangiaceae bacterium]|nr:hypothetical protein [Streptosporangiaceae bacterium]
MRGQTARCAAGGVATGSIALMDLVALAIKLRLAGTAVEADGIGRFGQDAEAAV